MPGSGKSNLARALGDRLDIQVISRDLFKSGLFRAMSGKPDALDLPGLAEEAYRLFFETVAGLASEGLPTIAESALFAQRCGADLNRLNTVAQLIQIRTQVSPELAKSRYRERLLTGRRSAAHGVAEWPTDTDGNPTEPGIYQVPSIGRVMDVDTTEGYDPSLHEICTWIEQALRAERS